MFGIGVQMCDFGKLMLVCCMQVECDYCYMVWEWFGYGCIMVLLLFNEGQVLVVIMLLSWQIEELLVMDEVVFGEVISVCFEYCLGCMQLVVMLQVYLLVGVYVYCFVGECLVLIGDVVVGMYLVIVYGFNLGLVSVQWLVQGIVVQQWCGVDIVVVGMLVSY